MQRGSISPLAVGLALAAAMASGATRAQTPDTIAYVLKIEGRWTVGNAPSGRTLAVGESVSRTDLAAGVRGGTARDRLTLVAAGKPYTCTERCEPALLASLQPESRARVLADAVLGPVMKIFQEKPDFPATVVIRGRVADGVAPLDDGRIDMGEILRDCRADRVDLRFQSLGAEPTRTIEPIVVPCDSGRAAIASARGVTPGLYRVDVLQRSSDGYVARGVSAWVLVSAKSNAAADASAFGEAARLTAAWGPEVDPDTSVAVQRAYLEHLSRERRP